MSLDWQDRYRPPHEPDRTLRKMTSDDIPAVVALLAQVGWTFNPRDVVRLLHWSPEGCFVLAEPGGELVGCVTTTPYEARLAWIGMMVVKPDCQQQGLGGQLMRAALDYLIARGTERIMLDATAVGRPLYTKLGFRDIGKVERWEGKASTYLGPRGRAMWPTDLPALLKLDAVLFGVNRTHILTRLIEEFPDLVWVDEERGQLEGYIMGRRAPNGVHLGPWMSWSAAAAERLLRVAFEQLQGQHITLNIPDSNGQSLMLARNHNLQRVRHCSRMIYGDALSVRGELLAELAVGSLATG
ncbi:MAG: GNAT family N-acetyltransferase [Anaerolineae bacterium]|nr:GNAT family N-acetyltransferase [Anaerolineae bacterium]